MKFLGKTRLKGPSFAECFVHDNSTATVITTQNVVHGVKIFGAGHGRNSTSKEGIGGTTSAFADYGATVTGTVKATDVAHGLDTDDIITINGGANYAGIHKITVIDDDNFYFTDTWVSDDGAQPWTRPDYMIPSKDSDIQLMMSLSATPETANSAFQFHFYINETEVDHFKAEQRFKLAADVDSVSLSGIDPALGGDKIWLGITNLDNAGDITIKQGNITMKELE